MDIYEKVTKIMLNTILELVKAADEFDNDRDSVIQSAAEVLTTMSKIATFANLTTHADSDIIING